MKGRNCNISFYRNAIFNQFESKLPILFSVGCFTFHSLLYHECVGQLRVIEAKAVVPQLDKGRKIIFQSGTCKNPGIFYLLDSVSVERQPGQFYAPEKSFLEVRGSVLYDYTFKSYVDSPFRQGELSQHYLQVRLSILAAGRIPLHLNVSNRFSNSAYFTNFFNIGLDFNNSLLVNQIKARLLSQLNEKGASVQLQTLKDDFLRLEEKMSDVEERISLQNQNQTEVENKERQLRQNQNEQNDSNPKIFPNRSNKMDVDAANAELQQLKAQIQAKKKTFLLHQKAYNDSVLLEKKKIHSLRSVSDIRKYFTQKKNVPDSVSSMSSIERLLLNVNKFSIGRTFLDYSELTVKNISLTGVNVEVNPGKFYFAFAGGKVNYLYRDFIFNSTSKGYGQNLVLLRAGVGKLESNNLIFSFYGGQKPMLMDNTVSTASSHRVAAISVETKLSLDQNHFLIAEFAKSASKPIAARGANGKVLPGLLDLGNSANGAYSVKLQSYYPASHTKILASFKKMGEEYQSFHLYPIQANTTAWNVRFNQQLLQRKLNIDASLRKNDWESDIAISSPLQTKVIFASLQASLRIKKWPFISIGYYPSSQLSINKSRILTENHYNTLNVIINGSYKIFDLPMNSSGVYTQFFNKSRDTGFAFFNALSYNLNHYINIAKWNLQASLTLITQSKYQALTVENVASYQMSQKFSLKGGLKWTKFNGAVLLGEIVEVGLNLGKYGNLQLAYDKAHLPGANHRLYEVEMGKLGIYKSF